jgi:hypothetical protein
MTGLQPTGTSRALFSLATGIEVASGQRTLEAVARAKLASVLFDEVVIESGLHVVEVGNTPMIRRRQATGLSSDLLRHSREIERGIKVGLAMRKGSSQGFELYIGTDLPRFDDAQYLESDLSFRYVSEYHTGLLDDLASLGADWVKVIEVRRDADDLDIIDCPLARLRATGGETEQFTVIRLSEEQTKAFASELSKRIEEAEQQTDRQIEETTPHDSMLAGDLREAITLGRRLSAVPTMSSAFAPIAAARGVSLSQPGAQSLGFLVPNFSQIPWEAIARFRDHPGAEEARGLLRDFEVEAATREPEGTDSLTRATGRAVTTALMGVTRDLAPDLPSEVRGPIASSTIGLIPIVGQFASLAISMGDVIAALRRHQEFEGSWVAAVLELRDAAIETLVDW